MIYTDGTVFTSDASLGELHTFAQQAQIDRRYFRVTRFGMFYEVRDAAGREAVKMLGATYCKNRAMIYAASKRRQSAGRQATGKPL